VEAPPTDVELVELGEVAPPRRGPGAPWIGAAGVAVLFGLAVVVGLPGLRSPIDPLGTAPPTEATRSAPPIALATDGAGPTAFPWAWTEFELRGYGRGSSVANVWALDGLFVIEVETDEGPDGGPFGPVSSVLLASEDGTTWQDDRVDLPVPGFVIDVGAVGGRRLAVLGRPDGASSRQVWTTDDGTWQRHPDPSDPDLLLGRVDELVFTGCDPDGDCDDAGWGAIVGIEDSHEWEGLLLSSDGIDWIRPDLALDGAASLTRLSEADGTWYVVATRGGADADPPVTDLLSSTDLVTWTAERVTMAQGGGRAMALGLAGPIVVGSGLTGAGMAPRAWLRSTGGEWFDVEAPMLAGRSPASMDFVIAIPDGYLAMSASTGDVWLSPDGLTWANRPAFHAESGDTIRALATSGGVVVAGGRTAGGRPALWRTVLPGQLAIP
jgi:hypothetical protein